MTIQITVGGVEGSREPRGGPLVIPIMDISRLFSPATTAPRATILIRLMAGAVFVSEGMLKFVYANQGVGRFTKLGFPAPGATATAVAMFEIVGGVLLIAGLYTRLIALGFSIEMIVAMLTTKISLYLGTSPLAAPAVPPKLGVWAVLHETRSDWAQLMCCVFLVVVGAGALSLDVRRTARRTVQTANTHAV